MRLLDIQAIISFYNNCRSSGQPAAVQQRYSATVWLLRHNSRAASNFAGREATVNCQFLAECRSGREYLSVVLLCWQRVRCRPPCQRCQTRLCRTGCGLRVDSGAGRARNVWALLLVSPASHCITVARPAHPDTALSCTTRTCRSYHHLSKISLFFIKFNLIVWKCFFLDQSKAPGRPSILILPGNSGFAAADNKTSRQPRYRCIAFLAFDTRTRQLDIKL